MKLQKRQQSVFSGGCTEGERSTMNTYQDFALTALYPNVHSFVFIGEAGSGKSEIAINVALALATQSGKPVHFYDLDMTKPLFRSRDQADFLSSQGVHVHFEEQFMDAPTVTGGVTRQLMDADVYTVLDVGGDYIGARSIGGYAPMLNRPDCAVFYVINPFRPWSMDIDHIDKVLSQTLGVSHVRLDLLHLIGNPNLGVSTCAADVLDGIKKLDEMVGPYKPVEFTTVMDSLIHEVQGKTAQPVIPITLYLTYEWEQ